MMTDYLISMNTYKVYDSKYILQIDPCIFNHITLDMMKKYVNKDYLAYHNNIVQIFTEYRKQLLRNYQSGGRRTYHTVDGIRKFLETGIVTELPDQVFSPMESRDRVTCIRMLLKSIEQNDYDVLLLKNWPYSTSGFLVDITEQVITFQVKNISGYTVYLLLDIPRFLISFNDFFENVIDHMCYTHEETITAIKELLAEAEEQLSAEDAG